MITFGMLFAKGFVIGFSLAMILGPIGIFCIQQTLRKGFKAGFAAGLGAATADGLYGTLAGFGLTFISDFLVKYETYLHIGGGIFLIYLGLKTLFRKESPVHLTLPRRADLITTFTTTLFLTLANPVTILGFTALLTALGVNSDGCGWGLASTLFTAVFLGSTTWWFILIGTIASFRSKISMNLIQQLNKFAGAAIALFGILIMLKSLLKMIS